MRYETARIITTDENRTMQEVQGSFRDAGNVEFSVLRVVPTVSFQTFSGMGGAFTEAGGAVYASMPQATKARFMEAYFGAEKNAYSLCRTHMQSCDFALGNYSYLQRPWDRDCSTFSVERDDELLVPFIQDALKTNPELELIASPWSPPWFMKTNLSMNRGGRLRKGEYDRWARMMALYLSAYESRGIHISRLTMQNEPLARQTWDSCKMSPEEEMDLLENHVKPALLQEGHSDVKLFIWDHNKDRILERVKDTIDAAKCEDAADGVAFHWYTGDHFEQLEECCRNYPGLEFLMTEGCCSFSDDPADEIDHAEHYAHDLIGDLNAGAHGFIDWNMLLDEKGGPNHKSNNCDAPVFYDKADDRLIFKRSFHYLGHFSRFIHPGAKRILISRPSDLIECTAFENPDGERAAVICNESDCDVKLELVENGHALRLDNAAHSITTVIW